jgi:tetratricopeptide (TPR) repeat protein
MRKTTLLLILSFGAIARAQSPQSLVQDAITKQKAGDLDGAVQEYREFLKTNPDAAVIRSNLGAALAGLGRFEEAITEYQAALKQSPSLPGVSLNLALAYYKMGRIGDAATRLAKVHKETPANTQATLLLADCDLRLGENKKVIELLTPLQQPNGGDLAIVYMLGTALVRDGQTEKGQVLIDKILKNGDSAEARLLLGTTKLMVNDFAGALVDLQKAVELNPNLPEVYAYYGTALLSTGDQAGAQEAFEHALRDDPNNFDANLRMGMLLHKDERNDEALKYIRHALEIRPGDLGVRYQIASIELSVGQVEAARGHLESLVAEAPNFTEAHVSLATVYYREKRKTDGDRERAIVEKLNAEKQAKEKGVNPSP